MPFIAPETAPALVVFVFRYPRPKKKFGALYGLLIAFLPFHLVGEKTVSRLGVSGGVLVLPEQLAVLVLHPPDNWFFKTGGSHWKGPKRKEFFSA